MTNPGPSKSIMELGPDDPLRASVIETLHTYGLDSDFIRSPPGILMADLAPKSVSRKEKKLLGFGVFHDMKDPAHHPGTAFDMDRAQELMEMKEVGLYRIALLHSTDPKKRLAKMTRRMLAAVEQILEKRHEQHALVIPLLRKANEPAFPLWEELGFSLQGMTSYYMETDLTPFALPRPLVDLPDGIEVVFMEGLRRYPIRSLARCYASVFLSPQRTDASEAVLNSIVGSAHFAPHLSLLVRSKKSKKVVGFLLAEQDGPPDRINITVVGLFRRYRAMGVPLYCFPLFAARCLDNGIRTATQVTSRQRVVHLIETYLGGRISDELVWLIRAS